MQRTFSREVEGECIEYEAGFGFSLSVALPDVPSMVDEAYGLTQELLDAVQGGYVRVGPWNGHSSFTNPVAGIFYSRGRWCLCIRGGEVRDLSTASDVPITIARSAEMSGLRSEIFAADAWYTRQIRERGTAAQRVSWVQTRGVVTPVLRNVAKGLGPLTADPFFPPPELFHEARESPCAGRGYTEQVTGGASAGWPFRRFVSPAGGSGGDSADVVEHFRECPSVEPADSCPGRSATKRLKSCAANTLEKGELCVTGGSCPEQEGKSCHGKSVAEVSACVESERCCADGRDRTCSLGCCPDRGRDPAAIGTFCGVVVAAVAFAALAARKGRE